MRGVVQKYAGKTEKNVAENLVMPDFLLNTHTHTHTFPYTRPASLSLKRDK